MRRSWRVVDGDRISARALLLAVCVFPFVWMALSSIKTLGELYTVPPVWLPKTPTLENYRKVLFESNVPRYFLNSTVISLGATAIALVLAIFASYGFARFNFRGKPAYQAFILIGQLLPTAAIIVPLFITLRWLGLVNTYLGLILVYMILTLPLSVWMLTSYFKAIPVELEEAAIIDGASRLGVLFRITLPLSLPGIVAIIIYAFVTTWNEFIFALVLAQDCARENAADRHRRVHHRVQHRLGRRDGRLADHDAADRDPLLRHAAALHRRADRRRAKGVTC